MHNLLLGLYILMQRAVIFNMCYIIWKFSAELWIRSDWSVTSPIWKPAKSLWTDDDDDDEEDDDNDDNSSSSSSKHLLLQIGLQSTKKQLFIPFSQTLPHNIPYYKEALGVTVRTEDDRTWSFFWDQQVERWRYCLWRPDIWNVILEKIQSPHQWSY